MAAFASRLVTPERVVFEEEVQAVFLRTDVGEAAFLPGHTPLIGAITPGSARFQREDDSEVLTTVHGGFVQVEGDAVIVLTPVAELAEEIDVERASGRPWRPPSSASPSWEGRASGQKVPRTIPAGARWLRLKPPSAVPRSVSRWPAPRSPPAPSTAPVNVRPVGCVIFSGMDQAASGCAARNRQRSSDRRRAVQVAGTLLGAMVMALAGCGGPSTSRAGAASTTSTTVGSSATTSSTVGATTATTSAPPSGAGYEAAKAQWASEGLVASSALQNTSLQIAVADLEQGQAADPGNRSGYTPAIAAIEDFERLPITSVTPSQDAEATADVNEVNAFFGLPTTGTVPSCGVLLRMQLRVAAGAANLRTPRPASSSLRCSVPCPTRRSGAGSNPCTPAAIADLENLGSATAADIAASAGETTGGNLQPLLRCRDRVPERLLPVAGAHLGLTIFRQPSARGRASSGAASGRRRGGGRGRAPRTTGPTTGRSSRRRRPCRPPRGPPPPCAPGR